MSDILQAAIFRAKANRFNAKGAYKPSPAMANTLLFEQITELKKQLSQAHNDIVDRNNKIAHLRRRVDELRVQLGQNVGSVPPEVLRRIALVCSKYSVSQEDLLGYSRLAAYSGPRQILFYLMKQIGPKYTWTKIGQITKRDHTTIMHGVRRLAELRANDPAFDAEISALESELMGAA